MSAIRLQEAIQAMGGYLLDGRAEEGHDRLLTGVSCDSRQIAAGELFRHPAVFRRLVQGQHRHHPQSRSNGARKYYPGPRRYRAARRN